MAREGMFTRLVKPVIYLFIFLLTSISIALILGEEAERKAWEAAPSTLSLYSTNDVCRDEETGNILNCGQCGACSNLQDIKIYHETRSTLTNIMTTCAFGDLIYGNDAYECLIEESGMTPPCSKCWVQNYHCNKENCMRTCFKHRKIPFLPSLKPWNSEPLDPCIACDEKFCGPDFLACAGANRRRVGVVSDIERDLEREVCNKVDWDWILGNNESSIKNTEIETDTSDPPEYDESEKVPDDEQEEKKEEETIDSVKAVDDMGDKVEVVNAEKINNDMEDQDDVQNDEIDSHKPIESMIETMNESVEGVGVKEDETPNASISMEEVNEKENEGDGETDQTKEADKEERAPEANNVIDGESTKSQADEKPEPATSTETPDPTDENTGSTGEEESGSTIPAEAEL